MKYIIPAELITAVDYIITGKIHIFAGQRFKTVVNGVDVNYFSSKMGGTPQPFRVTEYVLGSSVMVYGDLTVNVAINT